jgi:hypothetical protein
MENKHDGRWQKEQKKRTYRQVKLETGRKNSDRDSEKKRRIGGQTSWMAAGKKNMQIARMTADKKEEQALRMTTVIAVEQ